MNFRINNILSRIVFFLLFAAIITISFSAAAFALSKKDLRRTDDRGPVEVVALYLNPLEKENNQEFSFEITLDTHSGSLSQYDMKKITVLRIDGGPEINALGWFKPGGGGHHTSGILKFKASAPADAKLLELLVKNVGGVDERIFKWELPIE